MYLFQFGIYIHTRFSSSWKYLWHFFLFECLTVTHHSFKVSFKVFVKRSLFKLKSEKEYKMGILARNMLKQTKTLWIRQLEVRQHITTSISVAEINIFHGSVTQRTINLFPFCYVKKTKKQVDLLLLIDTFYSWWFDSQLFHFQLLAITTKPLDVNWRDFLKNSGFSVRYHNTVFICLYMS